MAPNLQYRALPVLIAAAGAASSDDSVSDTGDDLPFAIIAGVIVFGLFLFVCVSFCVCSYRWARRYRNLPQQRRTTLPRPRQPTPRPSPTLRPMTGWEQPGVLLNPFIARLAQRQTNPPLAPPSGAQHDGRSHNNTDSVNSTNASENDSWKNEEALPPYTPPREEWLNSNSNTLISPLSPAAVVFASPRIGGVNHNADDSRDVEYGQPLLSQHGNTGAPEIRWAV